MYIEGNDFFEDHLRSQLKELIGYKLTSSGSSNVHTNLLQLNGQNGTITHDIKMDYVKGTDASNMPDRIESDGGRILMRCQNDKGRAIRDNGTNDFRIIACSFVFGALIDGEDDNTKSELMRRYMDYLHPSTNIQEVEVPQSHICLFQNWPNPFNSQTVIAFSLTRKTNVSIDIYNGYGQRIVTLLNQEKSQGMHEIRWDGLNSNQRAVPSGVYFYTVQAANFVETKRMIVLR